MDMTTKVTKYLEENPLENPTLFLDLSVVSSKYSLFKLNFPYAKIHYAVKCNPEPSVIKTLLNQGSYFDTASIEEIELCLSQGVLPEKMCFGSTIKKSKAIKKAFDYGVQIFAFDSEQELIKIAENAPGSKVYCRLLIEDLSALVPLTNKFGCTTEMAVSLMRKARELGLNPYGLSFHTGSQQINVNAFDNAIKMAYEVSITLKSFGIDIRLINMGGGFPAYGYDHEERVPDLSEYKAVIESSFINHFGEQISNYEIFFEPGRYLVADAGIIKTEVILIAEKCLKRDSSWLYIDTGVWTGLGESSMAGEIKYKLNYLNHELRGDFKEALIGGPTCDGVDIMSKTIKYKYPKSLSSGDTILIESCGAYSKTMCAINFNGFRPLDIVIFE